MRVKVLPATPEEIRETETVRRVTEELTGRDVSTPRLKTRNVWWSINRSAWVRTSWVWQGKVFLAAALDMSLVDRRGGVGSFVITKKCEYGHGLQTIEGTLCRTTAYEQAVPATKVPHNSEPGRFLSSLVELGVVSEEIFYNLPSSPRLLVELLKEYEFKFVLRQAGSMRLLLAVDARLRE